MSILNEMGAKPETNSFMDKALAPNQNQKAEETQYVILQKELEKQNNPDF